MDPGGAGAAPGGPSSPPVAQAELTRNGTRAGSVLLINRRDGKRELKNANALLKALEVRRFAVVHGRPVVFISSPRCAGRRSRTGVASRRSTSGR